jgi:predicted ATPase
MHDLFNFQPATCIQYMIHLRSIKIAPPENGFPKNFPFNLPILQALGVLEFSAPVTFFVGENGSGKSTLLETLACAAGSIVVGSESVEKDRTLAAVRKLALHMRLSWQKKTRKGFFLRAEDFFGYAKKMAQMRAGLEQDLKTVDEEYQDKSATSRLYARMPYAGQLNDLEHRYGEGLDSRSHGESFLALFQSRFVPGGLYLLDEPEAPLSPLRQVGLIALLKQMVDQQAQFIIATHSPILLAYPGAIIYSFDTIPVRQVRYNDLEHVTLTRSFLNNPDSYLKHL